MQRPEIKILGDTIEIYEKSYGLIDITEYRTLKRDGLFINQITIKFRNFDYWFSANKPSSTFSGNRYEYKSIRLYDRNGIKIWDGLILKIVREYKSKSMNATIYSVDRLYRMKDRIVEYESAAWEAPASAAKNIMDNMSFTNYNNGAINESIVIQEAAGISIKCNFNESDETKFNEALNKLAEIGVADCFTFNNDVIYRGWEEFEGGCSISITSSDLISHPKVDTLIGDIVNDYKIKYYGASDFTTDEDNDNYGEISRQDDFYGQHQYSFDGSEGNQIMIENLAAAVAIGNNIMKRSHIGLLTNRPRSITTIQFELPFNFRKYLNVTSFLKFTYPAENWDEKIFEVMKTVRSEEKDSLKVLAYEVQNDS